MNLKVFISYSWDNENHKDWVLMLADSLVNDAVDVILDRYELRAGTNIDNFVERNLQHADRVLVICTPNYKTKADDLKGGVGQEYSIIRTDLKNDLKENEKVIAVLRSGTPETSIPKFLLPFLFVSFSDDKKFDAEYENLLRELYKKPRIKKPPLGNVPVFENYKKKVEFNLTDINEVRKQKIELEIEEEKLLWNEACRNNTIAGYRIYLNETKKNTNRYSALKKIEELEVVDDTNFWQKQLEINTIRAFQEYISISIKKKFENEAKNKIEELENEQDEINWLNAQNLDTIKAYEDYVNTSKRKLFLPDAQKKIEEIEKNEDELIWLEAQKLDTIEAYENYLRVSKKQLFMADVQKRLISLQEDISWDKCLKTNTTESYEKYLIESKLKNFKIEAINKIKEAKDSEWLNIQSCKDISRYQKYVKSIKDTIKLLSSTSLNEAKETIAYLNNKSKHAEQIIEKINEEAKLKANNLIRIEEFEKQKPGIQTEINSLQSEVDKKNSEIWGKWTKWGGGILIWGVALKIGTGIDNAQGLIEVLLVLVCALVVYVGGAVLAIALVIFIYTSITTGVAVSSLNSNISSREKAIKKLDDDIKNCNKIAKEKQPPGYQNDKQNSSIFSKPFDIEKNSEIKKREDTDKILVKIRNTGYDSLTEEEKDIILPSHK